MISKNRRLTPRTMQLFLSREATRLALYDCSAVTSEAFQTIPHFAPNLEEVVLQYCGQLDNAAFEAIGRLAHLHTLDLYGPYLVRKEAWLAFLAAHGARLRALKLRETPRFDKACVEALVTHAPQLQELGLAQIGPLDDACVALLAGLKHLSYVDLSQPGVSAPGVPPASLHDESVRPLVQSLEPCLEVLRLDRNAALSDAVGAALARCTLRVLSVEHCGVSSEAWAQCFGAMPKKQLEEVYLGHCDVSDAALDALVQDAPRLRVLSVNSADALTPAAFARLAEALPPLEVLDVSFVRCIDDGILTMLASKVPTLQTLYLFGCNKVTPTFQSEHLTIIGRERGRS